MCRFRDSEKQKKREALRVIAKHSHLIQSPVLRDRIKLRIRELSKKANLAMQLGVPVNTEDDDDDDDGNGASTSTSRARDAVMVDVDDEDEE